MNKNNLTCIRFGVSMLETRISSVKQVQFLTNTNNIIKLTEGYFSVKVIGSIEHLNRLVLSRDVAFYIRDELQS